MNVEENRKAVEKIMLNPSPTRVSQFHVLSDTREHHVVFKLYLGEPEGNNFKIHKQQARWFAEAILKACETNTSPAQGDVPDIQPVRQLTKERD